MLGAVIAAGGTLPGHGERPMPIPPATPPIVQAGEECCGDMAAYLHGSKHLDG